MVVLSHHYWTTHMGADPKVVGKTIALNGHSFEVIGVAPENFQSAVWGQTPDLFVPMSMLDTVIPGKGKRLTDHTDRWMNIIGRLREGETTQQAEAGVAPLWHALRAEELKALGHKSPRFVDEFLTHSRLVIEPGARGLSYSRSSLETPLLAVMAMALLVLLLAAVNVASLLLVRSAARVQEFAVRYAMGARSGRILQQLLIEGALIGLLGGAAGMLLAPAAMRLLVRQITAMDENERVPRNAGCAVVRLWIRCGAGGQSAFQPGAGDPTAAAGPGDGAEAEGGDGDRRRAGIAARGGLAADRAERAAAGRRGIVCAHDREPAACECGLQHDASGHVSHQSGVGGLPAGTDIFRWKRG